MFIKINKLYNFLISSGYTEYANTLEKIALEESDFKDKYPNIYSAWEKSKTPPLSAYLAQISRAEAKGIDLSKEEINSFQDIIQILKGEKQKAKSSKSEEVLGILKKEGVENITKEDVELAFGVGLNSEEIIYLAKDKCNHTWEEKLHYADRFKKERLSLFDKDIKLSDFKDIDEVRDEYFSRKNTAPFELKEFYEGIKERALNDSEVIYNSKNYIVAHSKSEKAAQYWEQSCVTVNDKGVVSSGLCSAHPYDSLFNSYDHEIHSFQIITKEYETLKETPRTSFMTKNKGYNLISFSIYKDHLRLGDIAWGGQDTVNRFNEPVSKEALFIVLGEEYDKIKEAIKDYCKDNLGIKVKGFVERKEDLSLGIKEIEEFEIKDPEIIELAFKNCPPNKFFTSNLINLNEDLYNKYLKEKIDQISVYDFFDNPLIYIPEEARKEYSLKKSKEFGNVDFFKKREKGYVGWLKEDVGSRLNTKEFKDYIPKDILEEESYSRAKELKPEDFFDLYRYFPKENRIKILEDFGLEKAYSLNGDDFLKLAMPILKNLIDSKKYNFKNIGKFKDIFSKKIKDETHPNTFFEKNDLIYPDIYEENLEEKINGIEPRPFFKNIHFYPKDVVDRKIKDMAEKIAPRDVFYSAHKIPKEYLKDFINEKLLDSSIKKFYNLNNFMIVYRDFSDIISDEVRDEYLKHFRFLDVVRGKYSKDILGYTDKSGKYISYSRWNRKKDHSNFEKLFKNKEDFYAYMHENLSKENIYTLTDSTFKESLDTFDKEISKDMLNDIILKKIKSLDPKAFFRNFSYITERKFPKDFREIAESKAGELSPEDFYDLKDKIPEDIFENLDRRKGLEILKRYSSKKR